jgi:hypothetical protein
MSVGTITRQTIGPHGEKSVVVGDLRMTVTHVVGSASYTTGGDALTAANLGLKRVLTSDVVLILGGASNAGAVNASYVKSSGKLQCWTSASAEVASAGNVSGLTFKVTAYGY